ncbi:DUF6146 family protein [Cochleicola gelatinilyticus]|uniref:Lipoprotein n=1 Tax=Cochleicola gelatinilyticus TaxID=1763537 RepID=A0A167H1U1_9FLAO|nr:DUF6146 family protein [Cochleicola gelatinilyticus]OAB78123.1 hypothetical protein ULVI_11620 [Cochleicola gelatinilyticus]
MKFLIFTFAFSLMIFSCDSAKSPLQGNTSETNTTASDTVRIANDSLEYEIIIFEPGFNSWLVSQEPRGYYGQSFLEGRNKIYVGEYNNRVRTVNKYPTNLYPQIIDYDYFTDYGYEVNYMLYNYFIYFQERYNQKFIIGRN